MLVNRGWVPADPERRRLPEVEIGESARVIRARIDALPRPGLTFDDPEAEASGWPQVLLFPHLRGPGSAPGTPARALSTIALARRRRRVYPRLAATGDAAGKAYRLCDSVVLVRRCARGNRCRPLVARKAELKAFCELSRGRMTVAARRASNPRFRYGRRANILVEYARRNLQWSKRCERLWWECCWPCWPCWRPLARRDWRSN